MLVELEQLARSSCWQQVAILLPLQLPLYLNDCYPLADKCRLFLSNLLSLVKAEPPLASLLSRQQAAIIALTDGRGRDVSNYCYGRLITMMLTIPITTRVQTINQLICTTTTITTSNGSLRSTGVAAERVAVGNNR